VRCSLGCRLINAGFDGRDALQQALRIYRETDHLVGIQEVLSALGTWYLRQGNLDAARDCHQQLATLTHEMGFLLGQATAAMAMGDYFFRRGDYARALAAYEQAQALAVPVALQALIALNRANTATLMNMPERAEAACREALARLQPTGRADQRSLAYYILGNARTRQGDWAGAIAVWREGLAIDEASQNWLGQAEKLQAIAQATVMHHYQPGGPPIPDPVYAEAMRLYEAAIARLHNQRDQSAAAVIANTYQLQGQTAITCGRPLDALRYLEQARDAYAHLDMAMQTANTDAMLGLLCYDLGGRGHPDLYGESERFYMQALDYYLTAGMRDTAWKVRFYLALTTFRRGVLSHTPDDQQEYWHQTVDRLNEASQDIDHIRGHFIDRDAVATESGRLALVADKDKVYTFAVQFHYQYLHDAQGAFTWLERLKGRAFLDHLATTPIRTPDLAHPALIAQERALLDALRRSATQTEGIRLSDQLHALWTQMAHDGAATEYVALRRGRPLLWYEMRALLQAR
jgi:tetratricopeptide (TPR) repeat protein